MKQNVQNGTILVMIKKYLETLMIFLSQLKTFIQKRPTYKTTIAELFSKTSKKKKISYK